MKSNNAETYKKIISQYADKINFYMKTNQELKSEIEDLKTTLKINKDLLFSYITSNSPKSEEIIILNNYMKENKSYLEMISKLQEEKMNLDLKVLSFSENMEDGLSKIREELEKSKVKIFLLQNQLQEKDSEIKMIKREFNRGLSNSANIKEIVICEPNKNNLELNNELAASRELLSKISKFLNSEKIKNEKLEKRIKDLERITEKEVISINNKSELEIRKNQIKFQNLNESLLTDDDLNITDEDEEEENINLETPSIKFPDKIKSNFSINAGTKNNSIIKIENSQIYDSVPKLNLSKIKSNYQSCADIKIKNNNFPAVVRNSNETELHITINKLNSDLNEAERKLKALRNKIEKFKTAYTQLKDKLKFSEENLESANNKIQTLECHMKRMTALTSTDDRSCDKIVDNTSMVQS